jgi:putative endonuclease
LPPEKSYFAYAISSVDRDYIYAGISDNVERRVDQHNNGYEKTTRPYRPFRLIYTEKFNTRIDSRKKEKFLKSGLGKQYLRKLRHKSR